MPKLVCHRLINAVGATISKTISVLRLSLRQIQILYRQVLRLQLWPIISAFWIPWKRSLVKTLSVVLDSVFSRILFTLQANASSPSFWIPKKTHQNTKCSSRFSIFTIFFTLQASASSPSLANHFGMAASNSFFSISEDDPVNSSPTKTGTELVVYQKKICQITAVTYSNILISRFFFKQETFPAWTW